MTDILERLRDPSKGSPNWAQTMYEGAAEIERLRNIAVTDEMVAAALGVDYITFAEHPERVAELPARNMRKALEAAMAARGT